MSVLLRKGALITNLPREEGVMMTDLTVFAHLVRVSGQVEQQFACHDVPHLERRVGAAAAQQATVGRPRHLVDTLHMTPQSRQEPASNQSHVLLHSYANKNQAKMVIR